MPTWKMTIQRVSPAATPYARYPATSKGTRSDMPNDPKYPLSVPAIRIRQPLGEFYAVSLPASVLVEVCYSHTFRVEGPESDTSGYAMSGTQREFDFRRAKEIGQFLQGTEAA